uniref:Secreted protein n=1 Tax=Parascaris univalens TaxID=6257 RepID=A0A915CDA2_PARUN
MIVSALNCVCICLSCIAEEAYRPVFPRRPESRSGCSTLLLPSVYSLDVVRFSRLGAEWCSWCSTERVHQQLCHELSAVSSYQTCPYPRTARDEWSGFPTSSTF